MRRACAGVSAAATTIAERRPRVRGIVGAATLTFLALLTVAAVASAAPAAPITFQLTQPDGAVFMARQYGDEQANGTETESGYTITRDGMGVWRYAMTTPSGSLAAGLMRADAPASPATPLHLRAAQSIASRSASLSTVQSSLELASQSASLSKASTVGSQPELVLLVRFRNQAPSAKSTAAAWHQKYFGRRNSVGDFYAANSYGQFNLEPAHEKQGRANDGVVGWLSLNMNHPNTQGDAGAAANLRVFRKAVDAADAYVDFASYDSDRNGYVSATELHVTVILAGYDASYATTCGKSVWGHHSAMGSVTDSGSADGVVIGYGPEDGGFTEFGEQHCRLVNGARSSHLATIGIMAHEFGHDIGLPDLYDTDYSSYGIGGWSLMSLGTWNTTGSKPLGSSPSMLDAWSKWTEGWLTPVRVQGAVKLANAENNPSVIQLLANSGGPDWSASSGAGTGEYFLVENRQRIGYDAGLPGCGVLIWHINESRQGNNADARRLVDLEEADGRRDLDRDYGKGNAGDPGDAFGSKTGRTSFGKQSNPSSRLDGGRTSGVSVTGVVAPCGSSPAKLTVVVPSIAGD